MKDKIT